MATFKKLLKQIIDDNREIKARISPVSLEKAQKYDELRADLKHIELQVDSIKSVLDENGLFQVVVKYKPIEKTLKNTADGLIGDEMFKAINKLDLISYKDMKKIQDSIEKTNKLNKNSK